MGYCQVVTKYYNLLSFTMCTGLTGSLKQCFILIFMTFNIHPQHSSLLDSGFILFNDEISAPLLLGFWILTIKPLLKLQGSPITFLLSAFSGGHAMLTGMLLSFATNTTLSQYQGLSIVTSLFLSTTLRFDLLQRQRNSIRMQCEHCFGPSKVSIYRPHSEDPDSYTQIWTLNISVQLYKES